MQAAATGKVRQLIGSAAPFTVTVRNATREEQNVIDADPLPRVTMIGMAQVNARMKEEAS